MTQWLCSQESPAKLYNKTKKLHHIDHIKHCQKQIYHTCVNNFGDATHKNLNFKDKSAVSIALLLLTTNYITTTITTHCAAATAPTTIDVKTGFFYNRLPVGRNWFFTGYHKASSSDNTVCVGN